MKYKNKFEEFCEELKNFADADSYFSYYNDLKDRVITYIQNHPAFKTFSERKFEAQGKWSKKELYCEENDGKIFTSIDMKQANFNIMKIQAFDIFYDYDRSLLHFLFRRYVLDFFFYIQSNFLQFLLQFYHASIDLKLQHNI